MEYKNAEEPAKTLFMNSDNKLDTHRSMLKNVK